MRRISAVILTLNEADVIGRCIDAVRPWVDEVIVLDSGSTDETKAIAEARGARVFRQEWEGFLKQRQSAVSLAAHDWVFVVDADEVVSERLGQALRDAMAGDPDPRDGFVVERRDEFGGVLLPNLSNRTNRNAFIRIFNRQFGRYDPRLEIHEKVVVPGCRIFLPGRLIHWRCYTVGRQLQVHLDYSDREALQLAAKEGAGSAVAVAVMPILRFLWCYLARGAWRSGSEGFIFSLIMAHAQFVRNAKLWELKRGHARTDPPVELIADGDPAWRAPGETAGARVLFVNQTGEMGGAEHVLADIAPAFGSAAAVHLLSDGPLREIFEKQGIPVSVDREAGRFLSMRRGTGIAAALTAVPSLLGAIVRLAARSRRADVVYANSQKAFLVAAVAAILSRRPLVWHCHDIVTNDEFGRLSRRIAGIAGRLGADRIVTVSDAARDALASVGIPADRISVVRNGIAPIEESHADAACDRLAGVDVGGAPVIGVFSRLERWKGQHVVLESLTGLPNVHALFVGGPLFGFEDYERELKEQARQLGIADRAHFVGFRSDARRLMEDVDIIVHPSISPDPAPRVLIEAMLAGRPLVASAAGGAPEVIRHGWNGMLVKPGDADELARTLRGLINDRQAASHMAETARDHAVSAHTVGSMTSRLLSLVNAVADRREIKGVAIEQADYRT